LLKVAMEKNTSLTLPLTTQHNPRADYKQHIHNACTKHNAHIERKNETFVRSPSNIFQHLSSMVEEIDGKETRPSLKPTNGIM
jgi:hypothetical protein